MGNTSKHQIPFIPASSNIAEITVASVALGCVLGVVLAAANTYLGLKAGITVSASIPAAVISMAVLRGLLGRGTILENNIVQTIAASGESLAAGIIFTIPAMVLAGVWTEIEFWPTTLICFTGGLLGIVFMIPLRRNHIVEDKTLVYPEGVACAEVLIAGEKGGSGAIMVLYGLTAGALFKLCTSGIALIKGTLEWTMTAGKTAFYIGTDVSPALLGVGYIVGFNVGTVAFLGNAVAWVIAIPIVGMISGTQGDNTLDWFWSVWKNQIRYMGVGAMVVGGVWSIYSIRDGITRGVKEAFAGYGKKEEMAPFRTDVNMAGPHMAILLGIAVVLVYVLYQSLVGSVSIALTATFSMFVMSFFFVAVSSYVVGLLGTSNQPVSGMTICAVLATGGLLLLMGMTGAQGIMATLGVAGVVCCAACSAGDISQDLKTGYIIGATPRSQQWMEVLGAAIPAMIMAPVMIVLHHAYGIGTGGANALRAPQATLFASLTKAMFGEGALPWNMVIIGMGIGVLFIIADQFQKARGSSFRIPVMAAAVGIYLPFTTNFPIFIGGLISRLTKDTRETGTGVLFASGLVAGEAIMGVVIAAVIYVASVSFSTNNLLPISVFSSETVFTLVSYVALIGLLVLMGKMAKKGS